MHVTSMGRPGAIGDRPGVIILDRRSTTALALPQGLPAPPAPPTNDLRFVSQKHWRWVAAVLQHPEDRLIIEGYPVQHPRCTSITGDATQVPTTRLQVVKRQPQPTAA